MNTSIPRAGAAALLVGLLAGCTAEPPAAAGPTGTPGPTAAQADDAYAAQQDRASFTAYVNKTTGHDFTALIDAWLDSPTTPPETGPLA